MDLAYCNGVFHHIPPAQRAEALALVNRALRAGGLFSFWENSPWSLATRYVMSRCAFDRDAIMLTPPEARSLLRKSEGSRSCALTFDSSFRVRCARFGRSRI